MRVVFLLVLAIAASLGAAPARAAERLVTVTGEATVAVVPDVATISIGVSSQGRTAHEASDANSKQMAAVLKAIRDSGIADRDIHTSQLSLQPQYDSSKPGPPRLMGFRVTNQVTIKIRDIDRMPAILDRAIAAGANEMSGIEFGVSEQSKLLDQARDEAIADARRKAELYVKAAGGRLGPVVSITEEGATPPPRPLAAMRAAAGAVPVVPGERELRAAVTVSFELGQ
ncbi:MAG TPA: SIMPL domain-containing protein [Pseudolabrys sp.]|nr:SIMPL domain-containing protein [Pseudolabrys sp.]